MKIILLIDSNPDILENLSEGLELEGYKVISTDNPQTGAELTIKQSPQLIICEDFMSEPCSIFLETLISNAGKSKIPIIFTSTHPMKMDIPRFLKPGRFDYIIKPFGFESLYQMTEKHLGKPNKGLR